MIAQSIDFEAYLQARAVIRNIRGGRGWDWGVRTFDCPFCEDHKQRGWMNVTRATAGCFNLGCVANDRLRGGALEWARLKESMPTRGAIRVWLVRRYPGTGIRSAPIVDDEQDDWCRMPADAVAVDKLPPVYRRIVLGLLEQKWGLSIVQAIQRGLAYCYRGPKTGRIIIPIVMNRQIVAYQARAVLDLMEPKYKTSAYGKPSDPMAECGRPARSLLYNLDSVPAESEILLVEGPFDVMRWHRDDLMRTPHAVGLLGTALTPDKVFLLMDKRPERIIVALDAEPAAQARARQHAEELRAWGFEVAVGSWRGGKDAGSGAELVITDLATLSAVVRSRLE